jgi:ABC-type transport system involved in multi-copper enzyme maturation permease subunit
MQQPAALLLLLTGVLLTALTPVFQFHTLGEEGRLARDSGLAFQLVFGLVLAAASASSTLSAEIERGTAAATLCKPVSRPLFLLAKFGGVMGVVTIFWGSLLLTTLLAERASEHFVIISDEAGSRPDAIAMTLSVLAPGVALGVAGVLNFWRRIRFGVAAFLGVPVALLVAMLVCGCYNRFGHLDGYHLDLNGRVPAAAILIWLALAMFAALASALATRLRSGATLVVCLLVLAVGLTGDVWAGLSAFCSWRGILGGLAPNWQHFWMCDALADQGRIAWGYVADAAMYAGTWSALALGCGFLALRQRDLG